MLACHRHLCDAKGDVIGEHVIRTLCTLCLAEQRALGRRRAVITSAMPRQT